MSKAAKKSKKDHTLRPRVERAVEKKTSKKGAKDGKKGIAS
jgi:hypothetical protein